MRWPLLLLGLLTAMAAVAIAVAVIGEPPGARGVENARFSTMRVGNRVPSGYSRLAGSSAC